MINIDTNSFLSGSESLVPEGFLVGNYTSEPGATGCTVVLCPQGATAGADIRGAAPATRETDLLKSENMVEAIHGLVFSGDSAFGLDAAGGVMRWLEEQGAGLPFAHSTVPIVVGASLFDLDNSEGDPGIRPDAAMGYAACQAADKTIAVGRVGAARGATVGKLLGASLAMPGGLGAASFISAELVVTAIVAVNALGNIYDASSGVALAGTRDPLSEQPQIINPLQAYALAANMAGQPGTGGKAGGGGKVGAGGAGAGGKSGTGSVAGAGGTANTTLACILTNAQLSKAQANRCATMAHDGYARAIHPIHTSYDGDACFCLSCGSAFGHPDVVGTLAALAVEHAIHNAVSVRDLH